jgi:hypothetical protein
VSYAVVRGAGVRLGDAELASEAGDDPRLSKIVANLAAGSGADQASQLGGYAVGYVFVRDGADRNLSRVLDSTPGLSRISQSDGTGLWGVEGNVSRITITGGSAAPVAVAAGKVAAHTTIPDGAQGRVLRIADTASPGWNATLDGEALTPTTVDGWAQGFRLPATGGRLDVTFDDPITHTGWLWAQGFLTLVLVVMALPGRRPEVDDDLPEEAEAAATATADIPPQADGEGRRARRIRAAAEGEAAASHASGQPDPAAASASAPAPPSDQYGQEQWAAEYQSTYGEQQFGQGQFQGQFQDHDQVGVRYDPYDPYDQYAQADPYPAQQQGYDPYAHGGQGYGQGHGGQGYDPGYFQGYQGPQAQGAQGAQGVQGYEGQPYQGQVYGNPADRAHHGPPHDGRTHEDEGRSHGTDGHRRDGSENQ